MKSKFRATLPIIFMTVLGLLLLPQQDVQGAPPGGANSVVVTGNFVGTSEQSIGAVEGCDGFNIADLQDLGFTNYRIYAGMSRLEPVDDDGVYGSPSIDAIKADPNIIPWSTWDSHFDNTNPYFWEPSCSNLGISLHTMLSSLQANNITPIITLRPVDNYDNPTWAQPMNPPTTQADQNEWWQFVFAWVYWANVQQGLEIHDWEVHNEPDNASQGWDGDLQDYIAFTQLTNDAIQYVYDTYLPGKTYRLYGPSSTHANDWITESLIANDDIIDVVDWHRYGPPAAEAEQIQGWIDQYDSDGIHEQLYLGEWGDYRGGYVSVSDALQHAQALGSHSLPASKVDISSIFSLYDWSSFIGIIDINGNKREPYWALRLMTRGLQGGKEVYQVNETLSGLTIGMVASKDPSANLLYFQIVNRSSQDKVIDLDVSAHASSGTATLREYSDTFKDEVAGTAAVNNGIVNFTSKSGSAIQVIVPLGGGPAPTPTPPPSGGALHVSNIDVIVASQGPWDYAEATITVVDANNAPVGGVTVSGTFSGDSSGSANGTTAANGQVILQSPQVKNAANWTFCVDSVTLSGWTYDSAANVETCDNTP